MNFHYNFYLKIITIYRDTDLRKDLSSNKITRRNIMRNALVVEEDYFVAPTNQKL